MVKKLLKISVAVVVVLLVLLAVAWLMIDRIAAAGIERGASYATGVKTTVGSVNLSLLNSQVVIKGLTLGNPEGYAAPHLMQLGKIDVAADRGTILSDRIVVNHFEMSDLDLYIEQKPGGNNVSVIIANLKRLESPSAGQPGEGQPKPSAPPEKGGGKKVVVNQITIRNVVAHVQVLPIGGQASVLTVTVPEIVLNDVASDNAGGGGATVSELTAKILPAIVMAVAKKGQGLIPSDLGNTLQADAGGAMKAIEEQGGKLIQGVGGATKGAGGLLENVLGGKKK